MILKGYGIILKRLTEDKIELVRHWRNHPKIQQYMEYKEYITEAMQRDWFNHINNDSNYYFVIQYKEKEIGLINIKDIDFTDKTGEAGIFIWDDEYLNTDVPIRASLCQGDFIWNVLKLNSIFIHVLQSNKRAINYNKFWGYQLLPNQDNIENQKYVLTREGMLRRLKHINQIKKVLQKMDSQY